MTDVPERVRDLVRAREEARAAKDFARADALRDEIAAHGFVLRDTPQGTALEPQDAVEVVTRAAPARVPDVLGEPASTGASIHLLYEGFLDDLERFLAGFETHNDTAAAEVVVVDEASDDAERVDERLRARPWARALHLDRVAGWAAARNAGLRTSRGEIVVLADLSLEPTGDVVTPLAEALRDDAVAVAGPFGLVSDDMRSWSEAPGPDADAIEAYLLATARSRLRSAGLLHERFTWYRNADIDFSFQLRADGGAARVVPLPVRRHTHRGWSGLDEAERARRSKRNHYLFFDRWKHRPDLLGAPRL